MSAAAYCWAAFSNCPRQRGIIARREDVARLAIEGDAARMFGIRLRHLLRRVLYLAVGEDDYVGTTNLKDVLMVSAFSTVS